VCYPRVSAPLDVESQAGTSITERVRTGIAGLDDLLGGGLPRSSTTIVQGGTGTGKTLMGLQYLVAGAMEGEKGVFFTLEETPAQLRSIALGLGWDLAALEARDLLVIRYASPVELSTDRFLHDALTLVRELGARRAVFGEGCDGSCGPTGPRHRYQRPLYSHISLNQRHSYWPQQVVSSVMSVQSAWQ
jgi:circadian clock protein KaiC